MAIPEASTITAAGWLAPGVAYVNFTAFFGNDATLAELRSFLDKVKGAETLIIDARQHRGGGLEEMDMLFPQLFGGRTALVDMDTRESVFNAAGDVFAEVPSVVRVAAPASVVRQRHWATPAAAPGLKDAKVYLLTSHFTASAAEHLALALKRTGRATLVGETTRGAGNYGRRVDLGSGYSAFVPVGRTFDPDTGEGWEGTGVPPHLSVPADQALDAALKAAGLPVTGKVALANLR
jgi:C-terminal processing protease CtpA/Prc